VADSRGAAFVYIIPIGMIQAITNQQVGLNVITGELTWLCFARIKAKSPSQSLLSASCCPVARLR
jgi:hypothetical protein